MERVRNWRVVAHVLAPVLWFQTALLLTGLHGRYSTAQGGRPLEETPFFGGQVAADRLGEITRGDTSSTAYLFYMIDSLNAVLIAAGLASLVAFGLRALRAGTVTARVLLSVTLSVGLFDLAENILLTAALASSNEARVIIGASAGLMTGAKFISFVAAASLAVLGLGVGIAAWGFRSLRPARRDAP